MTKNYTAISKTAFTIRQVFTDEIVVYNMTSRVPLKLSSRFMIVSTDGGLFKPGQKIQFTGEKAREGSGVNILTPRIEVGL